jgi:hypothetical protein
VLERIGPVTELGSPQDLGVVRSRKNWVAVVSPRLPVGKLGWVPTRSMRMSGTSVSIHVDLSRSTLVLKQGDRSIRRVTVGQGAAATPTPVGRFALTDKLSGRSFGPWYGCCILALSARQEHLRPGWPGGDRIAIHGTDQPSSIGAATSNGCLHASARDLRVLMRQVPLGAPVFIKR